MTWVGLVAAVAFTAAAHAMSPEDYVAALKVADKGIARKKALASSAGALSAPLLRSLFGRPYQVGDRWEVAAYHQRPTMMRMSEDPARTGGGTGPVGIFLYEVVEVRPGGEVSFRVTQRGGTSIAPSVRAVTLAASERLRSTERSYDVGGGAASASRVGELALVPLDLPDLETAERSDAESIPELPERLRAIAAGAGYRPDPSRGFWFEQDDFFGRPVQAFWQAGDPWPAYLRTPHGVAILLRKEVP
jgi:hypothetical protein